MSVATDLVPVITVPERARPARRHLAPVRPARAGGVLPSAAGGVLPSASVVALHRPSAQSIAAPARLTHRGVAALAGLVAALAGALVWLASASAPAAPAPAAVPVSITVQSGDTLWSIAFRVAPARDPRAEVATLQHLNHLIGADLRAGQVLSTR